MTTCAAYREYHSSVEPALTLYAVFAPAPRRAPLLLSMHGWHGNVKSGHRDNVAPPTTQEFFGIAPEMRGRGDSAGKPDVNGWELQDAVDALGAAARMFPDLADTASIPRLTGGSGGGGNVLGIVGKFPDLFAAAVCECGISDYALFFAQDSVGEFRDEMEGAGWIGGNPQTRPEAYLSRGGRVTAMNLLVPLLLFHGEKDRRVPVAHPRLYVEAARRHGRAHLVRAVYFPEAGLPGHYDGATPTDMALRDQEVTAHLRTHTTAPALPSAGRMVVAGYLRTRAFELELESVDHVALLEYDLARDRFQLRAPTCRTARLRRPEQVSERPVSCSALSLQDFCREAAVPYPIGGM